MKVAGTVIDFCNCLKLSDGIVHKNREIKNQILYTSIFLFYNFFLFQTDVVFGKEIVRYLYLVISTKKNFVQTYRHGCPFHSCKKEYLHKRKTSKCKIYTEYILTYLFYLWVLSSVSF